MRLRRHVPPGLVRWVLALLARLLGPPTRRPRRTGHAPVTFVIWNVYATGGTVRTVLRQANALAERGRDVTVVSVLCHHYQKGPFFEVHPDVDLEILVDRHRLPEERGWRGRVRRSLDARPYLGQQFSLGREKQASALTDVLLLGRVARTRGVVVGTRIGINLAIARFARSGTATVAQEHLQLRRYAAEVRRAIDRSFPSLDLVVSLTHADAGDYLAAFPDGTPALAVVPNAIPDRLPPPADLDAHRVVSVGRLDPGKGQADLIDAFAIAAAEEPGWELHLVGEGRRRASLEERIEEVGLTDRVVLVGETKDVDGELRQASIFALTSHWESFGLVILEAMAVGLPVVSYATPIGPLELLDDGGNGLLAPVGDIPAVAAQLRRLMRDRELRAKLAARGRADAERFTLTAVTDRWTQLFDDLERGSGPRDEDPYVTRSHGPGLTVTDREAAVDRRTRSDDG